MSKYLAILFFFQRQKAWGKGWGCSWKDLG